MDPATAPPPAAGSSPGPGCPCSPRSPTVPLRSSSSRSSLHRALITAPSSSSPTRPAAATATATRTVAEPPLSDAISASPPFAAQPPPTRCLSPDTDTDTHCNSRPASGATTETSIEEVQEEGEGKGAAAAAACFHKDYVVPVHQVPLPSIPSPAISAAQALPRRFKRQSSSSMPAPALPPHAPSTAAADAPFPTASAATAATPTPPTSASAAGHEKRARKRSQRNSLVGLLSPSLASSLFAGLDAGGGATSRIASRTSITTISASKEWRERRQEKQRARVMSAGSGSGSGPAATCPSTGDAAVASGSSSPQTGAVALPLASGPDDSEMPQTHHYYQRSSSTHTVLPPPSATLTRRQMLGASSRRISLPTVPSMLHRSSLGSTIAAATAGGGAAAAAEAEEEEGEPDEERDSENPEIAAEPAPVRRRAAPAIPFGAAAANRTSMASIASFESLPEGHAVGSFAERSTVLVSGGLASGGSASGITKRRSVSREPSAESWLSLSAGGRARGCGFASASVLASGSAITDSPPSSPASPSMPDHEAPPPPAAAAAASRASHRSSSSSSSYSFAFGQAPSPLFTPGKARAALSQSVARPLSSSTAAVAAARMQRRALHRSSTEPAGGVGVGVVDLMALLQKRKNTAAELLDTERRYVAGLKMIHEAYYQPLHAASYGGAGRQASGGGASGSSTVSPAAAVAAVAGTGAASSLASLAKGVVGVGPAKLHAPSLSRAALNEIFSNFSHILHLNTELLALLEQRLCKVGQHAPPPPPQQQQPGEDDEEAQEHEQIPWDPVDDDIGDILVSIAPYFKMYSLYVKNFSAALARIEAERKGNDAFAKFLKQAEAFCAQQQQRRSTVAGAGAATKGIAAAGVGLGFQAHLLSIVQRIPRYKLLVDGLIKTTPLLHKDYHPLITANAIIEQVASSINESIRQHEASLVMLSIQRSLQGLQHPLIKPGRNLLLRGTLWKSTRRNVQPREFFLFTDCIVYASPLLEGAGSTLWQQTVARYIGSSSAQSGSGVPDEFGVVWTRNISSGAGVAAGASVPQQTHLHTRTSSFNALESGASSGALVSLFEGQQLLFRGKFDLQDCTVVSVEGLDGPIMSPDLGSSFSGNASALSSATPTAAGAGAVASRHAVEIRTPGKSFAVYAPSAGAKLDWLNAIRTARADYMTAKRTLLRDEMMDESIEARRERRRSANPADTSRMSFPRPTSMAKDRLSKEIGEESEAELAQIKTEEAEARVAKHTSRPSSLPTAASQSSFESIAGLLAKTSVTPGPFDLFEGNRRSFQGLPPPTPSTWLDLKVLEEYNAPVWVPDNQADRCIRCSEPFSIWRRKHHCRLCGQIVCWSCSTRNFLIATYDEAEAFKIARACDACYDSVFPPEDSPVHSPRHSPCVTLARPRAASQGDIDEPKPRPALQPHSESARNSYATSLTDDSPAEPTTPFEAHLAGEADSRFGEISQVANIWAERAKAIGTAVNVSEDVSPGSSPARRPQRLPLQRTFRTETGEEDPQASRPYAPTSKASGAGTHLFGGSKIQMMLKPQMVQAATSGTGTLRLLTPRLTTPEHETPPMNARSSMDGLTQTAKPWSNYFDHPLDAGDHSTADASRMDAPRARAVDRHKKRMSAAARLSTVYDLAKLAGGDTHNQHRASLASPLMPHITDEPK